MTDRQRVSDSSTRSGQPGDLPGPDIAAFIRYCHRRRGLTWPELYDEMCGVASRREFNGWDHAELASRGLAFSLFDMPRVAGWARAVVAREEGVIEPAAAPAGLALEGAALA